MKGYGYIQINANHRLFFKRNQGKITFLLIYVDDMIIWGDDVEEITNLQNLLNSKFEMKILKAWNIFGDRGSKVKTKNFYITKKYVLDLLAETCMFDCKPADMPMMQNLKLIVDFNQTPTDKERYQMLARKLIYLSLTRPDIAFAVSIVSRFLHKSNEQHMDAVMRILHYLKSSPRKGSLFTKHNHLDIKGYTYADWTWDIMDRKLASGYFTYVGENLVSWKSKNHKVVAFSSAEAKFRGMKKEIFELLWLRDLMTKIGFDPTKEITLFCDNKAAINITHNPVAHDRTKHVEIDQNSIRQTIDMRIIHLPFVKLEDQTADILTMVGGEKFHHMICKLGMRDLHAPIFY